MTAAPALVFPGGRTLAGWWKQLVSYAPRALWVGHLLLHRVEALVAVHKPFRVDPLPGFVLRAVSAGASLEELDDRLHLGRPLIRQILQQLESEKLLERAAAVRWSLTSLGRQALEHGQYPRGSHERRSFSFVESEQPGQEPRFLHLLNHPSLSPWPAAEGWRFDVGLLTACLRQTPAWKQQHNFPLEVDAVLTAADTGDPSATIPPWQRVILDRPEHLAAALILAPVGAGHERLLGFAVQQEGWGLQAREPVFTLNGDWRETFPDLTAEPAAELWRQAWRAWCQPRNLPPAEAEACVLERQDYHLRVTAPARLVERLRAARSDVFKEEAWLLAGSGRLRSAARIELIDGAA
jgi:hypothetical protein